MRKIKEVHYMSKSGIVNVRMVITEEKILSNIDKVKKAIMRKIKEVVYSVKIRHSKRENGNHGRKNLIKYRKSSKNDKS